MKRIITALWLPAVVVLACSEPAEDAPVWPWALAIVIALCVTAAVAKWEGERL